MNNGEPWALEWSHEANMFHVQPLADSIKTAREHFLNNSAPNDWITIYVGTEEEVDKESERLDQVMAALADIRREGDA